MGGVSCQLGGASRIDQQWICGAQTHCGQFSGFDVIPKNTRVDNNNDNAYDTNTYL